MLLQARSGGGEFQAVDLNELAAESLHLAWMGHRSKNARQEFESWPSPVMVKASRSDLSRAMLNLMTNALWSIAARQKRGDSGYEPLVRVQVRENGAWGEVSVFDNGLGLSSTVKGQLFVPFFTTKPLGEGTGLGLALTREIVVDQHGGRLEFEGEPDRGARFSVLLPLLGAER
jgi:C4-dicarboxylate-specific signal transduction histidine kinase